MSNLLLPDIAKSFNNGFDRGQAQQFNRLAGQMIADPSQAQGLLGQAASINPGGALAIQGALAQQQQAQQAQQRAQQTDILKQAGGAARYMLSAVQTNDPAKIQGAYQAVKPFLAQLGQAQGKVPPDQFDPSMLPAMYQLVAKTQDLFPNDSKLYNLAPGGQLRDGSGALVASAPFKPAQFQYESVPNGTGTAAGVFDPNTGQLRPAASPSVPMGGQNTPAPAPLQSNTTGTNGEHVNFVFAPGTDPAIINATKAAAAASGVIPQNATFGVGTKQQPAPSGYRYKADGSLEAIPGGPADKSSTAQALGDPYLTGDAYLGSIQDVGMQQLIKAIAEGREQVPRIYRSSKGGEIGATQIAAAVSQYDPTFNAQDYNSRNRTRIAFTSGKPYQDMLALNQAAQHVGQLSQLINSVAGHSIPVIGDYVNSAENAFTDPSTGKTTAWNTIADAVAHETRKVFAGGSGGTLQELEGYLKQLRSNASVPQKQAAIQNIARLLQSRIGLLRDAYAQGMGRAGDPFQTTFPGSAQILNTLADESQSQVGGALPSVPASVSAAPTATNPQTGQRIQWNGSAWVPAQ